jgi:septal ring factor EnvC (AmiA/AmiB activator)
MPPALSRDPELGKDKLDRLKKQLAERDTDIRRLNEDIVALKAGMQETARMLRDTSAGLSPTQRISRANAWIILLIGQHGLPLPTSKTRR